MSDMAIAVRLYAISNLSVSKWQRWQFWCVYVQVKIWKCFYISFSLYTRIHCVLQCVAVCCCVLLCVAVCCCVLLCVAVWCSVVLLCVAMWCYALQWSLWQKAPKYLDISLYVLQWVRCSLLQRVGMLQCVAMYCSDLFCKRAPWIVRSLVECVVVYYGVLQYHSCSVLQCVAVCCSDLFCKRSPWMVGSLVTCVCMCMHMYVCARTWNTEGERETGILPPMQLYVHASACVCLWQCVWKRTFVVFQWCNIPVT